MTSTRIPTALTGLFCLFFTSLFSQNTFQWEYGGPGYDAISDVLETGDGYLAAGETFDSINGKTDALLLKTDKNGATLWQKTFGQPDNDGFELLARANGGGWIAWGYTRSSSVDHADAWLVKLDDAGNMLWQKTVGETGFSEYPTGRIIVLPDGYILSGTKTNPGYSQAFVLRVDNNGETLWSRFTPSTVYNNLTANYLSDSLLYLTGTVNGLGCWRTMNPVNGAIVQSREYLADTTNWLYRMHRTPEGNHLMTGDIIQDIPGLIRTKGWVQKVGPEGQVIWSKTYKIADVNFIAASEMLPDGSCILGLNYYPFLNSGFTHTALIKIDTNGAVVWAQNFGSTQTVYLGRIVQTADGGFITAGFTEKSSGANSNRDAFVMKTDSLGNVDGCCADGVAVLVEDVPVAPFQETIIDTSFKITVPFSFASADTAAFEVRAYCPNQPPEIKRTVVLCPGEPLTLGDSTYTQPATVMLTLPSTTGGCDTLATFELEQGTQTTVLRTIVFGAGDTVTLGGVAYTQPGTLHLTLPSTTGGCDTLAIYTLAVDSPQCLQLISFLKRYEQGPIASPGRILLPSADGNLYVFGEIQAYQGPKLLKVDTSGNVLWMRRLDFLAPDLPYNFSMIEDSDGFLVGFGNYSDDTGLNRMMYAFRYNPDANELLWYRHFAANQNCTANGLVEAAPGGRFLLYDHVQPDANDSNSEIWQLDRNTGALVNGRIWRYDTNVQIRAARVFNGALYATGVFANPASGTPGFGIAKIDAGTGTPLWTKVTQTGKQGLEGQDIAIDFDGRLLTLANQGGVWWVQKSTIEGDLLWLRRYEAPTSFSNGLYAAALTVQADGYVVTASGNRPDDNKSMVLMKISLEGNFLWAKELKYAGNGGIANGRQSLTAQKASLFFVAQYHATPFSNNGMWFGKTDLNGQTGSDCNTLTDVVIPVYDEPATQLPATLTRIPPTRDLTDPGRVGTSTEAHPFLTICSECKPPCEDVLLSQTISFCPGDTVTLGGTGYAQSGTVTLMLPSTTGGCDTIATYTLERLSQPVLSQTIQFCPGDTVTLGGTGYTQPGTVTLTLPSATGGCDTIATYTLQYKTANQASILQLTCPKDSVIIASPGITAVPVAYDPPAATSDCVCPDLQVTLNSGGVSGSLFPLGVNTVCYRAEDACGSAKTCCFTLRVDRESACDIKTVGCLKFELLSVNRDAGKNGVYRVRITNNCSAEITYAYIQLPAGVEALQPADNSVYAAPGGPAYTVRNPNFSPFYSLRFKPVTAGLVNGQSEVFRYVLPAQTDPDYIHVAARLASGAYAETHFNVFYCPVGIEPAADLGPPPANRNTTVSGDALTVFPNPAAAGTILSVAGKLVPDGIFLLQDLTGRTVLENPIIDNQVPLNTSALSQGLYFFKIWTNGQLAGSGKLSLF